MERTNSILVRRLVAVYDPFTVLFGQELAALPPWWFEVEPETDHVEVLDRNEEYHRRRVAHFVKAGRGDPIEVDNQWYRWTPGRPIVTDGHHRLCAAVLASRRRIECSYSGVVRTLRWLEGKGRVGDRPWE